VLFLDSSRNNPTSWQWAFTGANIAASTDRNPIVQFATPGTYTIQLKVTNAAGADSITKIDYITVLAVPPKPSLTSDKSINLCDGDSVTLSTNASTFVWFRDSLAQNNITTNSWNVKQEGKYFVRETNQAGCFTQSDILFVTASITPPKPTITKSLAGNSFCDGTTFTLTSSAQSNNTWIFNNNILDSQVNNQFVSGQAGTYGLRVGEKGCYSFADSVVINALPKPATSNISGQTWAVRNTDQDYTIVRGDANSTIQWNVSGASILFGQGSNAITVRFGTGSLANISVFETGANGCRGETKTLNVSLVNTGINDELLLEKTAVFPNPVSQNMEILFNATANTAGKLIVTDILGKIISEQDVQILSGENKIFYATQDLANGYYLYSINAGKAIINGKFVKQ
jgi:PKD repeat protein